MFSYHDGKELKVLGGWWDDDVAAMVYACLADVFSCAGSRSVPDVAEAHLDLAEPSLNCITILH